MQDAPRAEALLEEAARFLREEVLQATADRRLRFRVLIAANVLDIVRRELALEPAELEAEYRSLRALLGVEEEAPRTLEDLRRRAGELNLRLAAELRAGRLAARPGDPVWEHVKAVLTGKLRIASPAALERRGIDPRS